MSALLSTINTPADLRRLGKEQLPALATQLREFVLQSVAQTGGHLSSNLGTVELTIALHYVFNTPEDRLVWDVGHQTYPHKILTGRKDRMPTLRQWQGLSGFPKRDESDYDTFGVGHSSTSISAALGMAVAASMLDRHKSLTKFLMMLGVDRDTAESDACKLEHDMSEQSFEAICDHVRRVVMEHEASGEHIDVPDMK